MNTIRYVKEPATFLVKHKGNSPTSSGSQQLLLGARLHVDESTINNGWAKASTAPDKAGKSKQGFVELDRLSEKQQLKIFYLDVGQGDAAFVRDSDHTTRFP